MSVQQCLLILNIVLFKYKSVINQVPGAVFFLDRR